MLSYYVPGCTLKILHNSFCPSCYQIHTIVNFMLMPMSQNLHLVQSFDLKKMVKIAIKCAFLLLNAIQ